MDPIHARSGVRSAPLRWAARQRPHPLLALLAAAILAVGCVASGSPEATEPDGRGLPGTPTASTSTAAAVTSTPSSAAPTTSSDGQWLLAARQTPIDYGSASVVTVIGVGPAGEVVETPTVVPVFADVMLLWSPDGRRFLAATDTGPALVTIGPPAQVAPLSPDSYGFTQGAWSPDGETVVLDRGYPSDARTLELALAGIDGTPVRTLATGAYAGYWSPDGSMIAARGGGGLGTLVIVDPDTGSTRSLPEKDLSFLAWSPTSDSILALTEAAGSSKIVTTAVDDGSVHELATVDGVWDFQPLGWRDDHSLVIVRDPLDAETPTTVLVLDTQAGRVEPVAEIGLVRASDIDLAPDGRTLAFARYDSATQQASIWTQAIDGGAPARLTLPPPGGVDFAPAWRPASGPIDWPAWSNPESTPAPPPSTAGATLHLEVNGGITFVGDIPTSCSMAADGMRIEQETGEPTVQLGVAADGSVTFLSIATPTFLAFAGKTFTIAPPLVEVAPGASQQGGSLVFHGLPNAADGGTIDGSLTWSCALP